MCVFVYIRVCVCVLFNIFRYGLSEGGEYAFLWSTVGACIHPVYETGTDEPICRVGAETQTQRVGLGTQWEGEGWDI